MVNYNICNMNVDGKIMVGPKLGNIDKHDGHVGMT